LKFIIWILLVLSLAAYLFLLLSIELDLKSTFERPGAGNYAIINASFRIRDFVMIQAGLFGVVLLCCIYLLVKRKP